MSNPSTLNPIEKIAQLSAQRTARTDRLHSAVRALTDALEAAGCRPGLSVTVDGWTLGYRNVRSNVGVRDCWSLHSDHSSGCTDLGFSVGHSGYLHGDFGQPVTGPSRAHLLAFGSRAERFISEILAQLNTTITKLDEAQANVDAALATVTR